ncbi:unnamed protein product [Gadus morhua 'NCC']
MLSSAPTLAYYDSNRRTFVSADASSYGLGATLLQEYSGNQLIVADALSRSPLTQAGSETERHIEAYADAVVTNKPMSSEKLEEIRGVTQTDPDLQAVISSVQNGWRDTSRLFLRPPGLQNHSYSPGPAQHVPSAVHFLVWSPGAKEHHQGPLHQRLHRHRHGLLCLVTQPD